MFMLQICKPYSTASLLAHPVCHNVGTRVHVTPTLLSQEPKLTDLVHACGGAVVDTLDALLRSRVAPPPQPAYTTAPARPSNLVCSCFQMIPSVNVKCNDLAA